MSVAFEAWAQQARNVPIESELARRGVNLRGRKERAGPCPICGGETALVLILKSRSSIVAAVARAAM
jgi:hypothetical protein